MAFFDFMLRGAGILGLMVGGIGIANTMQVLLARRREEIGVLKTLGYSGRDMIALFVLEAGLLGLFGSLIGALTALLIAQGLTGLFANITTLLVTPALDPALLVGGVLVGLVTTILFAGYAILRASRVRPTVIFRREAVETSGLRGVLGALAFYALLGVPFAVVTSLVLGSVVEGVGILLFALAGLVVLGIALGGGTWLILRMLPVFRFNLLRMARNNMRKRAFSMLFAMIALFAGIFALGFAATGIQNSLEQFEQRQTDDGGPNLAIYSGGDSIAQAVSLLEEAGAGMIDVRYETPLVLDEERMGARDKAWDIEIVEGEPFGAGGVYVWENSPLATGAAVDVTLPDGSTQSLTVAGRYRNQASDFRQQVTAPILHTATLADLGARPVQAHVFARVDPADQDVLAAQIGAALPAVMTLTRADLDAQIQAQFRNLFAFALALSALALLAGVMLVANVVSLALIERRYEIGVMKAVGYTRRHVLVTLALEYGLIGVIASAAGLIAVQITIALITLTQSAAEGILWMAPATALIVLALGVGLTLVTALLAAWGPAQVRPLAVLTARG
jgi:putative ABC transport system permease protein